MALSSIDIDAAREVVRRLRAFVEDAGHEWREVGAAADEASCDSSALRGMFGPLMTIGELATELEDRVELAVLIEAANVAALGSSSGDGRVSFEVGGDEPITDVRSRIAGLRLAADLSELADAATKGEDVGAEVLERCAISLETHADDAVALEAMFAALGARGTLRVPLALPALFTRKYDLDGDASALSTADATSVEMQERVISALGRALATTSRSASFRAGHPEFSAELVAAATSPGIGHARALSELLRHGTYGSDFLVEVGTGLLAWEDGEDRSVWVERGISGRTWPWSPGVVYVDTQYNDPMDGVFYAMARNPQAALAFLNPDAGGTQAQTRMKHLLTERPSSEQFGAALAAAATGFRGSGGPREAASEVELARAAQSAWVASATVHYLANAPHGVPDSIKDDVGRVIGTYIYDVDRIANGAQGASLAVVEPMNAEPWQDGLRTGAAFKLEELRTVMGSVQTEEAVRTSLIRAGAFLNAARMHAAAAAVDQEGAFHSAVNTSSQLNGFLFGTAKNALAEEAKESDEAAARYIGVASAAAGALPAGGTITSLLSEQAQSFAGESAAELFGDAEKKVKEMLDRAKQEAINNLTVDVGAAVVTSGAYRADTEIDGRTKEPYLWFGEGLAYRPAALADSDVRDEFVIWTATSSDVAAQLIPDIATQFARGEGRGAAE